MGSDALFGDMVKPGVKRGMRTAVLVAAMLATTAAMAAAQTDLAGQWGALNQSDNIARVPGPDLGDFTGLPINDAAREAALAYSSAQLGLIERVCMDYTQNYIAFAPHSIVINRGNDPVTGELLGWNVSAGGSDRAPFTIWMDGRARPSGLAPRSFSGFTLGRWEGQVLVADMTHIKRGILRRNGVPLSDQATIRFHFVRHGDLLTIMVETSDPVYLDEPVVLTSTYRHNPRGETPVVNPTCFPYAELPGLEALGNVPHFLPGTNPDAAAFATMYHLPLEAAHGGAPTIYPEYRKKLQDVYVRPPECTRYCGRVGASAIDPR